MSKNQSHNSKEQGIQPIPVQYRMPKRWVLAKRKYGRTKQQLNNETIESMFMHMLYKVKHVLKGQTGLVFERDYRGCNLENAFAMHAFMSSTVYLYLECSLDFTYRIEFAFNRCHHEDAIRNMLNTYMFQGRIKEVSLQPTYATFFKSVLVIQHDRFIFNV